MKNWVKSMVPAVCAVLNGCAMTLFTGEPGVHKVSVDGENYRVSQLTASTWTAISNGASKGLVKTAAGTARLRLMIEKTSGCKVTDSDYSQDGRQFDAQVDCGGSAR